MSSVSQTPARRPFLGLGAFGRRLAVGMLITAVILSVALRGAWPYMVQKVAAAQLHGPDMALWSQLPLAIKLHIFGALSALVLGALLMTQRKGARFHRTAGWVWVSFVSLVVGSSLFIHGLNDGKFSVLHIFTAVTLISLPLALLAAKRHNVVKHRSTMMGLFYGGFAINLFIAFIPGRTMWNLFFG